MASGHGIKVVDGLNKTDKRSIFHFMYIVQLPYRKTFDTQMEIYTSMHNYDVSLAQYLQTHLSNASWKHSILEYGIHKKYVVNKMLKTESIVFKGMKMLSTNILKFIVLQTRFLK